MKIGLSYSRCVKDIVEGKVNIDDVLVLITRTNFDPNDDRQWRAIWEGYSYGGLFNSDEWYGYTDEDDEQKFRDVTLDLYNRGKMHQPRKFGAHPIRRTEFWLEAVLPDSELERNPAAKSAWEQFQMIAGLTDIKVDHNYR
jgi:hypothetical protein